MTVRSMRLLLLLCAASAACGNGPLEAAPRRDHDMSTDSSDSSAPSPTPSLAVSPISADQLCLTKGAAALGKPVVEPTLRGYAIGSSGDAASLRFRFHGDSAKSRELASGDTRRQLGLKLRAQDSCNVIYVMWRLDPKPALVVSVKRNPGQRLHRECGADGYTRVKPSSRMKVPAPAPGSEHELRAELREGELLAWIDDQLVWRGPLPQAADEISGPAGLRSDNVSFDLVAFSAPAPSASRPSGPAAKAGPAGCSADHDE